jgi:cytoskeletal protein CcmA (bactofilin family)
MRKNQQEFNEEEINTVFADDIYFNGILKFSGSLLIKGKFEGEIDAEEGHLFIGSNAHVKARIKAAVVSNKGEIVGDVETNKRFELLEGSRITGDVTTPDLKIDPGSELNGNCTMVKENMIPKVE